jgi:hypothetical protein
VKKYNISEIERRAIIKTRKILKIPESKHLSAFTRFNLETPNFDSSSIEDVNRFFENTKFRRYWYYECFIYDDSLNVVAWVFEDALFSPIVKIFKGRSYPQQYLSRTKVLRMNLEVDSLWIYIKELNPEHIFHFYSPLIVTNPVTHEEEILYGPFLFFCYKDGEITVVCRYGESEIIISCPLSEFKCRNVETKSRVIWRALK